MSLRKLTTDRRGLKVDWDIFFGAILFSFLAMVGYVLQKAEPVPMSAADQAKIVKYRAEADARSNKSASAGSSLNIALPCE